MKNLNTFYVAIVVALIMISCTPEKDRNSGKDPIEAGEKDGSEPETGDLDDFFFDVCDCKDPQTDYCKKKCEEHPDHIHSTVPIILDRPCGFPSACYEVPVEFREFFQNIRTEFPERTKMEIFTREGKLVASSSEEFGGSVKFDRERGLARVQFGLVNEDLLDAFLILKGQTAVRSDDQIQELNFEYELGKGFFKR